MLSILGAFTTDAAGELNVLGHDGHSLGVDGTEVSVLEETNQVCFACLLKCHYGRALEAELGLEILGNLTHETLEGKLADKKFGALLIAADFSEGNRSGPVAMWFLDSSGGRGTLPGSLCRQLFSRSLPSGRFASCLLGTSHGRECSGALDISIERIETEWLHNPQNLAFIST